LGKRDGSFRFTRWSIDCGGGELRIAPCSIEAEQADERAKIASRFAPAVISLL
jgi:hypothetical protein